MKKLWEKLSPWVEAIKNIDDPAGDYMINLEKRVQRLERDVSQLNGLSELSDSDGYRAAQTSATRVGSGQT